MTSMPTLTDRAHEHRVSRAEFERYRDERDQRPDGARYELLDGEIVVTPSPAPIHQHVVRRLMHLLDAVVPDDSALLTAPMDVVLTGAADSLVQPDLLLSAWEDPETKTTFSTPPALIVEILSPSTWRRDLGPKRDLYAAAGVEHYWVVAPDTPSVTIYRLGDDGAYREETHLTGDQRWSTTVPVEVTLCPADLVR
ncbi:MAG: Uma2 family endonuclease [Actinomycetales bacterium]|nr:Uma2 family endonuclease [Actinomycetales bacterium]